MLDHVINLAIMRQPINWVIVPLVVLLAGMSLALIFHPANEES